MDGERLLAKNLKEDIQAGSSSGSYREVVYMDISALETDTPDAGFLNAVFENEEEEEQDDFKSLVEVTCEDAYKICTSVLHKDMALGCEVMPADQAAAFAARFFELFDPKTCRYFSNGKPGGSHSCYTQCTVDSGVYVLDSTNSKQGILWVGDGD